jgi:hypothetical protein
MDSEVVTREERQAARQSAPLRRLVGRLEAAVAPNGTAPASAGELVERVLAFGVAISVAGVLAQTALHVTDIVVFDRGVNALDADEDFSAASWASIAATFGAAFAALLLGLVLRHRFFVALAVLFAFLSFDDFMRIHERVGEIGLRLGAESEWEIGRVIWPLIFLPLFSAAAVLLWLAAEGFAGRASTLTRWGLVLLAGAVALEASSTALFQLGYGHRTWPYETEVVLEEGAELAGWIWIASALTAVTCGTLIRFGRRP